MRVEPNLDFNIISPLDYSNSWKYVLVLSFKVILHRPTSEKVVPLLSANKKKNVMQLTSRFVTLVLGWASAPVLSALC